MNNSKRLLTAMMIAVFLTGAWGLLSAYGDSNGVLDNLKGQVLDLVDEEEDEDLTDDTEEIEEEDLDIDEDETDDTDELDDADEDDDYDFVEAGFEDVTEDEIYGDAIGYLAGMNILHGHKDGTFKPLDTINRAELMKLIVEGLIVLQGEELSELDEFANKKCFEDVPAGDWYAKYVCFSKHKGWIIGYENGKVFKPGQPVNFVEGLKITLEAFGIEYEETDGGIWYEGLVDAASGKNYIPHNINGFADSLQRDQIAELITRIIMEKEGNLEEYLGHRADIVVTFDSISKKKDLTDDNAEDAYKEIRKAVKEVENARKKIKEAKGNGAGNSKKVGRSTEASEELLLIAEEKLEEAKQKFEEGLYEEAEELAEDVKELAKDARMKYIGKTLEDLEEDMGDELDDNDDEDIEADEDENEDVEDEEEEDDDDDDDEVEVEVEEVIPTLEATE